jgi:glycine amidinotransferase
MSIWTNWDPLEEVIVGNCYTSMPEHWNLDIETRTLLNTILRETKEDLDNLESLLVNLGVIVHRPVPNQFPEEVKLLNFSILRATNPIVPRDQYLVYGNTIYQTYTSMPDRYLDSYNYYEIFKDLYDRGYNWLSQPPPIIKNLSKNEKWYVDGPTIYGEQ